MIAPVPSASSRLEVLPAERVELIANSPYGKLAQGVMGQRGWDALGTGARLRRRVGHHLPLARQHDHRSGPGSPPRSPEPVHDLGYSTPSCTTDGFITDAELAVVNTLDLYGLAGLWRESREALTGSREMWERKHVQGLPPFSTSPHVPTSPVSPVVSSLMAGTSCPRWRTASKTAITCMT